MVELAMTKEELSALTPEEKRIRIAELCMRPDVMAHIRAKGILYTNECLPDYLNDLNAMQEADNRLQGHEYEWVEAMANVLDLSQVDYAVDTSRWDFAHATAAQRADAFLLTLG